MLGLESQMNTKDLKRQALLKGRSPLRPAALATRQRTCFPNEC